MMPGQIGNMVRMLKIVDDEVIEQIEDLCDNIISIIETGDLQGIEAGVWNVLEAGLFGVTALQPNILLALFMIMQVIFLLLHRSSVEAPLEATLSIRQSFSQSIRVQKSFFLFQLILSRQVVVKMTVLKMTVPRQQ